MARTTGRLTFLAASAMLCVAAAADAPVQALAVRYSSHFRNGLVDGSGYWSDNVVEVVPVDATHAYVRFDLQFYNGHSCTLAGVAEAKGSTLVYVEPADKVLTDSRCTLTIQRQGAKLHWNDEGSCKAYCGARGSFLNDDLPWASKRPISYLPRLKGSSEYRTALTEWRTGHMVRP